MKLKFLTAILIFSATAKSQIIGVLPIADSLLYNILNYVPITKIQRSTTLTYEIMYKNILDTSYKMKKSFLDSGQTQPLSKVFYHQGKIHGPFEGYQMTGIQVKGKYKNGKLDGERITYFTGGKIMEKSMFTDGKRTGVWEYYNTLGVLKRKISYNSNGLMVQDEHF